MAGLLDFLSDVMIQHTVPFPPQLALVLKIISKMKEVLRYV